jgi:hypothetical protein
VHAVSDHDFASGSAFCEQFVALVNKHPGIIHCLVMSHGAHFELSGCMNKQNMQYWSEADP